MTRTASVLLLALAAAPWAHAAEPDATARVVLRWKPVTAAVAYELEIAKDAPFTDVVLRERTQVPGYRWRALPTETFYWRVRSIDAAGRPGDWSEPSAISPAVGAPVVARPANGAVLTVIGPPLALDLSVQPSELIREYTVELARDARFGGGVVRHRATRPRFSVSLPEGGTWYWRVRGLDLEGRETAWSEARTVRVEVVPPSPQPVDALPPWTTPPSPVQLRWGSAAAGPYELEVTGPGGTTRRFESSERRLDFAPDGPGTFQWRVRVVGAVPSAWTAPQPFTVPLAPPELLRPLAGAELGTRREVLDVPLAWNLPAGATRALVEVARDPEFTSIASAELRAAPEWTVKGLAFGTYFWRVMAEAPERAVSATSGAATFRVVALPPLGAPELVSPGDRAIVPRADAGPSLTLSWQPLKEGARYEVELWAAASAEQVTRRVVSEPRWTVTGLPEGDQLWRVRALDKEENAGAWSAARRFFFGRPPAARAEIRTEARELAADGTSATAVAIQLVDAEGRPVTGGSIEVRASTGRISDVAVDGDTYRARYFAPSSLPDGEAAWIIVRDRAFEATVRLKLVPPPGRVRLTALAGWNTTFGALNSPTIGLGAAVRLPGLADRTYVLARASFYAATTRPGVTGAPYSVQTQVGRGVLAASYEQPLSAYRLYAGAGVAGQLFSVRAGGTRVEGVLPGLHLLIGAWRTLGPGHLLVEGSYTFGGLEDTDLRVRTGGLTLTAGYGVPLF